MYRSIKNLLLFSSFVLLSLFGPFVSITKGDACKIRGMFVFGSSVVDNGNNNFLQNSLARADYSPYGNDFPLGFTGRFSNGENIIDILGRKLNFPNYIPPFNAPSTRGEAILRGVNYASGGSGILDVTGSVAVNVTSLNEQIRNFEQLTLPDLDRQLGNKSREILADKFLFVVGSGGNDYSLNYFLFNRNITIQAFTSNMTSTLSQQLKKLYGLGARKFILMGINPNGCSPMAIARAPTPDRQCIESLNQAVQMFNIQLKSLVDSLRFQMLGSDIVFVNSYKIIRDIIRLPTSEGFSDVSNSCCDVAAINEGGTGLLCRKGGSTCTNRSEFVYFDGLHTTQAVNHVIATKAFASNLGDEVYPFNVKHLSRI